MSKLFLLQRSEDKTGIVASGVVFENGKVVVCWHGEFSSIVIWNNLKEMELISCTHSKTKVKWLN